MRAQTHWCNSLFLFISLFSLAWPSWAQASPAVSPPAVSDRLKVPDGQAVLLKALGRGAQIYRCEATSAGSEKFAWTFIAPEATLINGRGETVGKHYAGPTWEANDGSKVAGAVRDQADAPDRNAIPWLLLKVKSNEGTGVFKNVTYIQRVSTEGGKAPAEGCDKDRANAEVRVDYRATYYFYVAAR